MHSSAKHCGCNHLTHVIPAWRPGNDTRCVSLSIVSLHDWHLDLCGARRTGLRISFCGADFAQGLSLAGSAPRGCRGRQCNLDCGAAGLTLLASCLLHLCVCVCVCKAARVRRARASANQWERAASPARAHQPARATAAEERSAALAAAGSLSNMCSCHTHGGRYLTTEYDGFTHWQCVSIRDLHV
jgi:hypothetical protein